MAAIIEQPNSMTAMFDFVTIGFALADVVPFSPMVKTFEAAVKAVPVMYQLGHRNGYAGELIVDVKPSMIQVVKCTPYPDDMTFGLLSGLARRFGLGPDTHNIITTERRRLDDERDTVFMVQWTTGQSLQTA